MGCVADRRPDDAVVLPRRAARAHVGAYSGECGGGVEGTTGILPVFLSLVARAPRPRNFMLRSIFIALLWPTFLLADSYRLDPDFPQLPKEIKLAEVSGVTINSRGEVFIFHRGERPIIAMDKAGKFLRSFGDGSESVNGLRRALADNY